jgi:hypothetical protein
MGFNSHCLFFPTVLFISLIVKEDNLGEQNMSIQDENRMLYILHRSGVSRDNIKWIMNDLKQSCVFEDSEDDYIEEWDFLDEQAFWLFNSDVSHSVRKLALDKIKVKQEQLDNIEKSQYAIDQEKRVQAKIKEMTEKGLRTPDLEIPSEPTDFTTRYGRSPLHEAIAMRDIRLVKKYLKIGKYLDKVDNNGHTAMEMAYYDNYKEALILFEKYEKKNKIKINI